MPDGPGGFTFNQYLVAAEQPLLFHTGPRRMFPLVRDAVQRVVPVERLRYIGLSHFEADECGSLNEWLAAAPAAEPVCGRIAAMVSINDVTDRPARALADGEVLSLGTHGVKWFDTPHLPHAWECGFLLETGTRTLLCGDLFTQGGAEHPALTESDILGPSEAFRKPMDYFAHAKNTRSMLRAPCRGEADDARVHARQRVARRRRRAAARAGGCGGAGLRTLGAQPHHWRRSPRNRSRKRKRLRKSR
jgi:flavorubredoxin